MNKVHFSSASCEWATPQDFFDKLNAEFNFTLDVCATPENAKCARYFTKETGGLGQSWDDEVVWLNPPYGRTISLWMAKAFDSASWGGSTVVCLIPARTDTNWWHKYVQPVLRYPGKGEVRFVKGRLKFGGAKNSAPFPSAVVIYLPDGGHW